MKRFLIPLGLFAVLVVFLAVGLTRDPREVPSPLIDKPAPMFNLPQVTRSDLSFSPQDMRGKVWLLNVWSSWCVSCRYEHPLLVEKFQQGLLPPVVGLSYKEVRGDGETDTRKLTPADETMLARQRAAAWLGQHGNPYTLSVLDIDGRVGID
jgi:cytochrome c biogenesis protein CcmG/thiol:disulfide interchange protein DsbE